MTVAVELTAAWWMEPTGAGRVRRMRGEIVNLDSDGAARLVELGAARRVQADRPAQAQSRRKAPAKATAPKVD